MEEERSEGRRQQRKETGSVWQQEMDLCHFHFLFIYLEHAPDSPPHTHPPTLLKTARESAVLFECVCVCV